MSPQFTEYRASCVNITDPTLALKCDSTSWRVSFFCAIILVLFLEAIIDLHASCTLPTSTCSCILQKKF